MTNHAEGHIRLTILVDNQAAAGLAAEHGFSVWIETPAGAVLFDTGQGQALGENFRRLGIPLERAAAIVLSHGHYDHTGGLPLAVRIAPQAKIFAHPQAAVERWSVRETARDISAQDAAGLLKESGGRVVLTESATEVLPGVHVTGEIPRRTDFEDVGGPYFLDRQGRRPDLIPDDQALWLEAEGGLVVVLGCAHAGVVNTLEYIRELNPPERIRAVVGGMHLAAASAERLRATGRYLRESEIELVVPCHCTGENAVAALRAMLGDRVRPCHAGATYVFAAREEG